MIRWSGSSLVLAALIAGCAAAGPRAGPASPGDVSARSPVASAAVSVRPTAEASPTPVPSGVLATATPFPPALSSPSEAAAQKPSPIVVGSPTVLPSTPIPSETDCRRAALRPSTLRALDGRARTACFGGTTLAFDAQLVVVAADIDWGTLQVPDRLRPISAQGSGGALGPVYVVDPGRVDDPVRTGLQLRVSDPSLAPATLAGTSPVRIEGHFDDPASSECRPDGVVWPELTDATAAQTCRALFVVTRIEPVD